MENCASLMPLKQICKLSAENITKIQEPTTINVILLKLGMKPDNFCTYCCVGEYGREYKKEKIACL